MKTQPTEQTCTVTGDAGTIATADVSSVVISCVTRTYLLTGTVSGLIGTGLTLANGSDTLDVPANATTIAMPRPLEASTAYAVMVTASPAGLNCAVTNGIGAVVSGGVSNIAVACTPIPYHLGGSISVVDGLAGLVLANGTDTLNVVPPEYVRP